ncbi:MAG: DUF5992 family protein [Aestuariibacter sp.]
MIKKSCFILGISILSTFAAFTKADTNLTDVEIMRMEGYTSFSTVNFDIVVALSSPCSSGGDFYLPAGSPPENENTKQVYSLLLAAFMSGKKISLSYQDGKSPNYTSSTNHCEIRKIWVPK